MGINFLTVELSPQIISLTKPTHTMTEATTTINIPSFEPPSSDDSDNEIWLLRAPANVDVSELLNNTQLNFVDPSSNNNILSRFTSSDGEEYALSLGDVNESQNLRLLVPDKKAADDSSSSSDSSDSSSDEDKKKSTSNDILVPYAHPFKRQIHITIANKEQSDLAVAPSQSSAPKPALKDEDTKVVNGTVEKMRLAYVPVAQRKGLKRRWNMPGGKIVNDESSSTTAITSTPTKDSTPLQKRTRAEQEADMVGKEEGDVVSVGKSSKKSSSKKSKKKKSRKSK